jgi:hypothetical protein
MLAFELCPYMLIFLGVCSVSLWYSFLDRLIVMRLQKSCCICLSIFKKARDKAKVTDRLFCDRLSAFVRL